MTAVSRGVRSLTLLFGCATGARIAKKRGLQQSTVSTCGVRPGSPDPMADEVGAQIVNGRPAPEGAWPWQVSLGGCGGTIISPEWVVSAAHCGNPRTATAGLHNRSQTGNAQARSIVENKKHPSYNSPARYANDLMLLRVNPPFDFGPGVSAACLPETTVAAGTDCWITGWGTLSSGGGTPSIIQEAVVDVKTNAQCDSDYSDTRITDDMLCANGDNNGGTTDACQGDSGGPLVCENGGFWFLEGATSWGYGCANPRYPGVWSRVAYNNEWVTQETGVQPVIPNPTPAPPPTPEPPTPAPGTWEVVGSGCETDGQCVQSNNYPSNYGNNQNCRINLYGEVSVAVDGSFATERSYDKLNVGGTEYHGTPPSNLADLDGTYTGSINWNTDSSVTNSGWRICLR